jgi:short chain dehydrogenase
MGRRIHGIRTFVPILLRQACEAHIVNTASVAGLVSYPLPYLGVYSAAKHAVVSIFESLSAELALANSQVKVSVLCPGFVRTQIMDSARHRPVHLTAEGHADPQVEAMWRAAVDSGSEPKDIAAQVLSAIRKEQLYILPHPEFHEAIRSHAEDWVARTYESSSTAKCVHIIGAFTPSETVHVSNANIPDFSILARRRESVRDQLGSGSRTVVTGTGGSQSRTGGERRSVSSDLDVSAEDERRRIPNAGSQCAGLAATLELDREREAK